MARRKKKKIYNRIPPKARIYIVGACAVGIVAMTLGLVLQLIPDGEAKPQEDSKNPATSQTDTDTPATSTNKQPASVRYSYEAIPTDSTQSIVAKMNLDAKIAQLFLVECPAEGQSEFVKTYQPAGVLYGAEQFAEGATVGSLANLSSGMQMEAMIPLFIAVQEEGGTQTPISSNKEFRTWPFQTPAQLLREGGWSYVENDTAEKSRLLKSMGINVNFAPNANVSVDKNDYMYERTLGQPATDVAQYVTYVVDQMGKNTMGSVMMHFPGYGNNPDNSLGPVVDERTLAQLMESDLLPFTAGIQAGGDAVLMSHNVVTAMDAELPASLSAPVHKYLRENMGFEGVIIADDLDVPAIAATFDGAAAAVKAVQAGNDLIIVTEDEYVDQYVAIENAIEGGHIDMAVIDQAVVRVLDWKDEMGILDMQATAPTTTGTETSTPTPVEIPKLPKPENPRDTRETAK